MLYYYAVANLIRLKLNKRKIFEKCWIEQNTGITFVSSRWKMPNIVSIEAIQN